MKKSVLVVILSVVALLVAVAAGVGFIGYQFAHTRPSETQQDVVYEVEPGKAFNTIAKDLEAKGLIRNATFFSLYARFKNVRSKVKVGEYLLRTNMYPDDVLEVITSGKSIARSFTVSEGLSTYEIAELYQKEGFGTYEQFMKWVHDPAFIKSRSEEHTSELQSH